jgi:hypothetical protein
VKPPDPELRLYKTLLKAKRADFARTLAESQAKTVTAQLAKCHVSAEAVMATDSYWQERPISMLKSDPEAVLGVEVTYGYLTPRNALAEAEFWKIAAKNPNKSIRDYDEKFEHSMPVPLVQNGELVYTLEGPKVYVNILMQLVKLDQRIDDDDPDFLKLIMDNIQMFERHWRKLVKVR